LNNDIKELIKKINNILLINQSIIIGIDGPTCSGKSSLALFLKQYFNAEVIAIDHFFLQDYQRTTKRLKEFGGYFDYERFIKEIITPLKNNVEFTYRPYNCENNTFNDALIIHNKPIIIIEGVYAHHPLLRNIYDFKIFLDIDEIKQRERLEIRSLDKLNLFINEWLPQEKAYFKKMAIKEQSDLVLRITSF
jgi:uridine kinase